LRADVLAGDMRLFYLLWLCTVEAGVFEADEPEPMAGIGPMTSALEAFAGFFFIDRDLVAAAGERIADPLVQEPSSSRTIRPVIAAMTNAEKTSFLGRLFDGDTHAGGELRALVRNRLRSGADAPEGQALTVGELRARAEMIRRYREHVLVDGAATERRQH